MFFEWGKIVILKIMLSLCLVNINDGDKIPIVIVLVNIFDGDKIPIVIFQWGLDSNFENHLVSMLSKYF